VDTGAEPADGRAITFAHVDGAAHQFAEAFRLHRHWLPAPERIGIEVIDSKAAGLALFI
jgi:hypothetical protein